MSPRRPTSWWRRRAAPATVARGGLPAGNLFPLGTTTLTYTATDGAGNTATAAQHVTVRDTTPPAIVITVPAATTYALNQAVAASYGCTDAVTPNPSCVGSVPNSVGIDTASVGPKSFTVNANDAAGNHSTASVSYSVGYNVCLLYDPTRAARSGSTLTIKIDLCDAAGANRSASSIVVTAIGIRKLSDTTMSEVADAGNANPDSDFRFDAALGGYIFNLKTTGLTTGTYALAFTATSDATTHDVMFSVK